MIPSKSAQSLDTALFKALAVFLTGVGTVLILAWVLSYTHYAFDFTDESFYLAWISNPFIYDASIYLFGFVYHPFYIFSSGDISFLRQINILITFGLAWLLVYLLLSSLAPRIRGSSVIQLAASAGLATSSLNLFDSWLVTPNYNSLALQSLMITSIGLLLIRESSGNVSSVGAVLLGVGGFLTFTAKPSSAIALTFPVLLYLLASGKFFIRQVSVAAVVAITATIMFAVAIDGSVLAFVERLKNGAKFLEVLGGGYTFSQILRLDEFHLDHRTLLTFVLTSTLLFITFWSMRRGPKLGYFLASLILLTFSSLTAYWTLGKIGGTAGLGEFQGLLIFSLVLASLLAVLLLERTSFLNTITVQQMALSCFFLALPHVFALGTNNNYWKAGSSASIFWLLSGLILLGPFLRESASFLFALPLAIATQAVTSTLLQAGLEQPYRQVQPLRLNTQVLPVGPNGSELVLSDEFAEYISSAAFAARKAGFVFGTPVVDLTGQSPGVLYAIGAENIGQAWMIGGYPGSLRFAVMTLARTPCDKIARAWVLVEPDGPRSIASTVMTDLGIDFPREYSSVGRWKTASGAGGYKARREQILFKPVNSEAVLRQCKKRRAH